MVKPLGQFDIDETEEGYLLHIGDGQETNSYSITSDQMAAIIETFLEMIPEDEDELSDEEDEEEDEDDDGGSSEETPPRLS